MATKKSRLHIPRPTARPGDEPDFSYLELAGAGSADRPSINARTRDIEWLSSGLVRILDDEHRAVGPWNPDIEPEKLQIALALDDAQSPVRQAHVADPETGAYLVLHGSRR